MTSIFDPLLTSKQAYLKYRISFGLYYVGEGGICEICSERRRKHYPISSETALALT
ncbi:Hypothetical protein FKW44_006582, partial [Caligus rogercresseyi]